MSELRNIEGQDNAELLKVRIKYAEESVEQAEQELESASGDERIKWENRLAQRKEDLEKAREELKDFLSEQQEKAA